MFSEESRFNLSHADGRIRVEANQVNDMLLAACKTSNGGAEVVLWSGQELHTDTRLPCIFVTDL
jgi:hypothetical protein